jgi:hypothetical protein
LALTSPTTGGRSVGIVNSRTQATEFRFDIWIQSSDLLCRRIPVHVSLTNAVFWNVEPFGFNIDRRFEGTCCLHIQGKRNNGNEEKW